MQSTFEQNNANSLQLSSSITCFSYEERKTFLLDTPLNPTLIQSYFMTPYDAIKMMDRHLTIMADLNKEDSDQSSFEFFKEACLAIQKLTLKPSLINLFNLKNNRINRADSIKEGSFHGDAASIQAEIVAKWWKTYFSVLEEAFETHLTLNDGWIGNGIHGNNYWFNESDQNFLEESLPFLEEHLHWKIMLLRALAAKEGFYNKMVDKGSINRDHLRTFDLIFEECHKYFYNLTLNRLYAVEKMTNDDLKELMRKSLLSITEYFKEDLTKDNKAPLLSGFFGKKIIKNLPHSVIMGEDGGFFLLLNSANDEELNILKQNKIEESYLKNITKRSSSASQLQNKLVIGQGTFGKIRVCLALSGNEKSNLLKAGDLVCCKKTDHFQKKKRNSTVSMNSIRTNCWSDYSIGIIGESVYAPDVYDLMIAEPLQGLEKRHCKGCTIQQFLPVLNGDKAFSKNNGPLSRSWFHQRAYFVDIFKSISKLLSMGICMTDLKPANTLYNSRKSRGSLIDLSGVVQKKTRSDLEKIKIKNVTSHYAIHSSRDQKVIRR